MKMAEDRRRMFLLSADISLLDQYKTAQCRRPNFSWNGISGSTWD